MAIRMFRGPKPGVIPNMGDVSQATRVHLTQVAGKKTSGGKRSAGSRRKVRKRSTGSARRSRTTRKGAGRVRSRRSSAKSSRGRLQKGSPAAKRRMAQLRAMQKRRRR